MKFYKFNEHGFEGSGTIFGIVIMKDYDGKIDIQLVLLGRCVGVTI